jgi:uncharacterized protein (DUF58 family)
MLAGTVGEEPILRGAYAELGDLLRLRYRRLPSPPLSARVMGSQAGNRLSKQRGRGIDFSEVRAYQPGDDVRTIDWRVTARKNKPHTKVFREERERRTLIIADQSQSMFFGSQVRLKSVAAAELAALGAWQALNHNDRVGGMVIGNDGYAVHKPYRSVKSVARFLNDLSRMNQTLKRGTAHPDSHHFSEALSQILRLAHSNYRIYFISDFQPHMAAHDHWRNAFRSLSRHNEVIAIRIYDPLEQDLPPADSYTVTDGESRLQFHAGNPRLRERYQERFESSEERLKAICRETMVDYRAIATHQPLTRLPGWT